MAITDATKVNWNKVEAYFQLNSIVNNVGVADGIIRLSINGELLINQTGVLLRTGQHADMKFNQIMLKPFIGDGSPVTQTIWYDDIEVRTTPASAGTTTITSTVDGVEGTSTITVLAAPTGGETAVNPATLAVGVPGLTTEKNPSINTVTKAIVAIGIVGFSQVQPFTGPRPNEPAGYTRIYENAYTALPAAQGIWSTVAPIEGCWKTGFGLVPELRTDPTAPSGEGVAYGIKFRQGLVSGFGPGLTSEWKACGVSGGPHYSKIYFSIWIKLAGGPNGDLTTWEFEASLTKVLGFFGVAKNFTGGGAFEMYGFTYTNGIQSSCRMSYDIAIPNPVRILPPNVGEQNLIVGQWHQLELNMELASSPTASDGILKQWISGTQTMNYSDVKFQDAGNTSGFYQKHNSPTWGGRLGPNKTRDDWIYYDHCYISGVV